MFVFRCCLLSVFVVAPCITESYAKELVQITGTITDLNGAAVKDAVVTMIRYDQRRRHVVIARADTDASGKYTLPTPKPDDVGLRWYVKVYAPNLSVQSKRWTNSGEEVGDDWDFQLKPSTEFKIRVVDQDQQPIAGATLISISFSPAGGTFSADDWKAFRGSAPTSDAEGWLVIPGYAPGTPCRLTVDHPDYVPNQSRQTPPFSKAPVVVMERGNEVEFTVTCEADPSAVAQTTISVTATGRTASSHRTFAVDKNGKASARLADLHSTIRISHPSLYGLPWYFYRPAEHRQVSFTLHEIGTVRGRVIDQESGKGVEGLGVYLVRTQRVIESVRTDENGDYEATLPNVDFEAYVSDSKDWVPDGTKLAVNVEAGKTQTLADLSVTPKPPVRGRVVTADGKPVAQAIVVISFREAVMLTDEEGRFEFQPRDQRDRFVQALHPYQRLSGTAVVTAADGDVEVVLEDEGNMIGMVVDQDGKPLAGLPVELKTSFSFGGRGISTVYHRTKSRDDGTYRFLGLTPRLEYQAQVRGEERSSSSKSEVVSGDRKGLGERSDRKPLKVYPELLKEVRQIMADEKQQYPAKFLGLDCDPWIGSRPLTMDDFKGKAILLCLGNSPYSLNTCEIAHQLYADRGLQVVAVSSGPVPFDGEMLNQIVGRLNITFPMDLDKGTTIAQYRARYASEIYLFGADGKFKQIVQRNEIHCVRNYMLYEVPVKD